MMYRKYPSSGRNYNYVNPFVNSVYPGDTPAGELEIADETIKIPSPNEPPEVNYKIKKNVLPLKNNSLSGISSIFKKVKIDEIILVGLILLLIDEKIEDNLLMLVLMYILVSGREKF
jgi:hypothetical protein